LCGVLGFWGRNPKIPTGAPPLEPAGELQSPRPFNFALPQPLTPGDALHVPVALNRLCRGQPEHKL